MVLLQLHKVSRVCVLVLILALFPLVADKFKEAPASELPEMSAKDQYIKDHIRNLHNLGTSLQIPKQKLKAVLLEVRHQE